PFPRLHRKKTFSLNSNSDSRFAIRGLKDHALHGFFRLPDKILKQVTVLGFCLFMVTLQSSAAVAGPREQELRNKRNGG
ncbi:hypothetical protein P8888_22530, partial [Bacillus haynesii]|nr:hypothetical protein [Bacillus haynesii]